MTQLNPYGTMDIGDIIDNKYKVVDIIGHGGMSCVYLVINPKTNMTWAVKEIRRTGSAKSEIVKQNLIAETTILRSLRHKYLPQIIDVIEKKDTFLILMDYIQGISLKQRLETSGAQPEKMVVKWSLQLCEVLQYLHTREPKIIYRDMKPDNVMLTKDGNIVLIDFGTARQFKENQKRGDTSWLGTKGYAAPEQFGGDTQTDERTDIYGLGITMYCLLTNHFPDKYPYEIYPIRHWDKSLSSGLEQIILKCTKSNPDDRYQTVIELMDDLMHYQELTDEYKTTRKHHIQITAASAVTSLALLIGGGVLNWQGNNVKAETYRVLLKSAETTLTKESQVDEYEKAIATDPFNSAAYINLIDSVFLKDNNLTQEEAERMARILGTTKNGKTYESYLERNEEGYDEFAFAYGCAMYYDYENVGNRAAARPWLEIAKDSKTLKKAQKKRSAILASIASYYDSLGQQNRAGDSTISYRAYWDDLISLVHEDLAKEDNQRTALVGYKELTYQIRVHAYEFSKDGVSKKELTDAIAYVDEQIKGLNITDEADRELLNSIEENRKASDYAIKLAFTELQEEEVAE